MIVGVEWFCDFWCVVWLRRRIFWFFVWVKDGKDMVKFFLVIFSCVCFLLVSFLGWGK